ncbi:S-layer protein [Halanaeroarchaeum sulfurireducens]|uniref:S-layer protein n=1 Tax=Halanaeroarchaeum sulfurireducens TaxID=1604004 RepID=A0A0F7PE97_9EURY|nr:S-layer protein [Halanaeroarchaeum sulfurireducens]ALG82972.1 S-layer protein [Halanaeroarchaeum sulfurireducens]
MHRSLAVVVAVAVVLSGTVGVAGVAFGQSVQGDPELDVYLPQETVLPGEKTELELRVANEGDMTFGTPDSRPAATTAHNVLVEAEAEEPLAVETGETPIGAVTEDKPGSAPIVLTIPEGTEPGTYEIDVDLEYTYANVYDLGSNAVDDKTRSVTRTVEITVDDAPRFAVENVTPDVHIGERGSMAVTLANTGSQPASDVRMTLESSSGKFLFGESKAGTTRVGSIAPGENATLTYDVAVQSSASVRDFDLSGTVLYTDPDGIMGKHDGLSAGVTPLSEQTFTIDTRESTLRVGEEGELHGTVTNTGPVAANDVVVQFAEEAQTIVPVVRSVSVGTLEPGASADFTLPIEVTTEGKAVPNTFDMLVTYRNVDNEKRAYEDVSTSAEIEPRRDQFSIEVAEPTITAGETRTLQVTMQNELDETVSDVELKMFVDDPLDSSEDEAFVSSLKPGESATATVTLSAGGDAVAKSYPASFDVRYDDADGTSQLSETMRVPISVTESESSGLPITPIGIAIALLILLAGGYWYWRD